MASFIRCLRIAAAFAAVGLGFGCASEPEQPVIPRQAYLTPPTVAATAAQPFQWGKGSNWEIAGSLIYSPVQNFDIGLELQYMQNRLAVQNPTAAFLAAGSPGLRNNGWSSHVRIERQF